MTAIDAPVAVDQVAGDPRPTRIVVVGVDGSHASAVALRWAADHVAGTDIRLRIITAYSHPPTSVDLPIAYVDLHSAAEIAARERAEAVLDEVFGADRSLLRSLLDEHIVAAGSIDRVMGQHCGDAELVVLGTQSRRRWRDRWRSSTTNRLTGHLDVPVIAVPEPID